MNSKILLLTALFFSLNQLVFSQSDTQLAKKIKNEFKSQIDQIGEKEIYSKSEKNILSDKDISTLKSIIDQKGYPTHSKVGESVAHQFWALVMQCNEDPAFQMNVLKLMHKAKEKGEVSENDFAMLADRVLMNQGKPQLYGTQYVFSTESGEAEQYKTEEPEKLQERRKSLNLPETTPKKTKIIPKVPGTAQRGNPNARY